MLGAAIAIAPGDAAARKVSDRDRFGIAAHTDVIASDGDVVATTQPTLVVDDFVPGVEIVIVDQEGNGVASSGPLVVDRWTVPEGLLSPGGQYRWHVLAPTGGTIAGTSQPTIYGDLDDLTVDGEMIVGSQSVIYELHQGPRDVSVTTGLGPQVAASGLRTSFFPHYDASNELPLDDDGNPIGDLPPAILPGPGAETVSETSDWSLRDIETWGSPKEERANKPWGGEPIQWRTIEAILGRVLYATHAEATITEDGGHAAGYNVVGTNVAPSYGTTITSDVAIEDGFVVSTGGQQVISSSFPLQTDFGFRALGYLEVPEDGTYRFGTQSPGGAELALYDTDEHDLGRIEVSADGAWWPTTLDEEYHAATDRFVFHNREVGSDTRDCGAQLCRTRFYEYEDPDDQSWYQVEQSELRWLLDDLRASGPAGDTIRWGQEVELEAGRQYPLAFTGWVGPIGGDIGIHVDGPGYEPQPLPFEWITAAGDGVVGFDRSFATSDSAPISGTDAAISGHGDALAVVHPSGALDFYDTDGGLGWTPSGSLSGVAHRPPDGAQPAGDGTGIAFDDTGSTVAVVADLWPHAERDVYEPVEHTAEFAVGLLDLLGVPDETNSGPFTFYTDGTVVVLEEPFWTDVIRLVPSLPTVRLEVDELHVELDESGTIVDGSVTGVVDDGGVRWPLQELEGGSFDGEVLTIDEISSHLPEHGDRSFGFSLSSIESTPIVPVDAPDSLDVSIIDRIDSNGPWSEGNTRVDLISDIVGSAQPDPELIPGRHPYQSVDVSPDGNTVVVSQPAADHQRITVIGRDHRTASWAVIGTFTSDDGRAAIGVDNDARRLAVVDGGRVALHTWTPDDGWTEPEELYVSDDVASLALDYFGQHLAIGESASGAVTVMKRSPFTGEWSEHQRLDGPGTFGHGIAFSWGLLAVTDADGLVRVYRDTGLQPWSNFGDWSQVQATGEGRPVASVGGTPLRVRLVETHAGSGTAFATLSTHAG